VGRRIILLHVKILYVEAKGMRLSKSDISQATLECETANWTRLTEAVAAVLKLRQEKLYELVPATH
jgi:hypothetical protein